VLIAADVFEHIENYYSFLRNIRDKANYKVFVIPLDMNILTIMLNRFETSYERDGHLHFFCPATALLTLRNCGYEIIDFSFCDIRAMGRKTGNIRFRARFISPLQYCISATFGKDFCQRLLGGYSLIVLTK